LFCDDRRWLPVVDADFLRAGMLAAGVCRGVVNLAALRVVDEFAW